MIAQLIGKLVKQPNVWRKLLAIAMHDPDELILAGDGSGRVYMHRYWLFNRITNYKRKYWLIPFSIRVHRIMLPDDDRHPHDHPFNARTWIMSGGYDEVRLEHDTMYQPTYEVAYRRVAGDTSELTFDQYHKITAIHDNLDIIGGGAVTLFMFGPYRGPWGFWVDGHKIVRAEYLRRYKPADPQACKAVMYSDQTICKARDLGWDANDTDRPPCGLHRN